MATSGRVLPRRLRPTPGRHERKTLQYCLWRALSLLCNTPAIALLEDLFGGRASVQYSRPSLTRA
eukprot:11193589-Lingulodinium_polyedra.AAC.1